MSAEFDAVSSATSNTGNATLSWSHTLGNLGGTGLIVVCAGGEEISPGSGNQNITGITFNGVAMTLVNGGIRNDSHSVNGTMYELHGADVPTAGTYTVVVSYQSANHDASAAGCMSFKGIKNQIREVTNVTTANGGGISTSVTTVTKNALIVSAYASQNTPNVVSSTGDTRAFRAVPGSIEQMETSGFYRIATDPTTYTVSVSGSNPECQVLAVAAFEISKRGGNPLMFSSGAVAVG